MPKMNLETRGWMTEPFSAYVAARASDFAWYSCWVARLASSAQKARTMTSSIQSHDSFHGTLTCSFRGLFRDPRFFSQRADLSVHSVLYSYENQSKTKPASYLHVKLPLWARRPSSSARSTGNRYLYSVSSHFSASSLLFRPKYTVRPEDEADVWILRTCGRPSNSSTRSKPR
jgi:hypothetical protein